MRERIQLARPLPAGTRVIVQTVYSLCKHEVTGSANLSNKKNYSTLDLLGLYPSAQGWTPSFHSGEVILTRTVNGLCPVCQNKSHLGEKGGFLAVIRGPAGVNGGIIRVTTIRLSSLPADYQKQAQLGTLDLPDELALLQILDSLDEGSKG
ncbi:MAG: hypothetical protein ABSC17_08055 [Thermacetogeniaceae bacterium]